MLRVSWFETTKKQYDGYEQVYSFKHSKLSSDYGSQEIGKYINESSANIVWRNLTL